MAEIRPLRAWKYNKELSENIDELTSPLFDVISKKQRALLYKKPYNSIHLSVPLENKTLEQPEETLRKWKEEKTIVLDDKPAIYVYYQYFTFPGTCREFCRKGFICNIKAYDWDEKIMLRHENTIPHSVKDRMELLEKTLFNVSPTHGLYSDEEFKLEKYMDESMKEPLYETEDYQGVKDVISVIYDPEIISKFVEKLKEKQVILADGHHRYESSLEFRKKCIKNNPNHTGREAYNYHFMYLTNMESDDLRIFPTHRLVHSLPDFQQDEFMEKIEEFFIIKDISNPFDVYEIILGKKWAFGLIFKDTAYKIRLKPEVLSQLSWNLPDEVKELDLTVMHYFILEKILRINEAQQRASKNIKFERNFTECLTTVFNGEADFALITKEITIDEVKKVCFSGYLMPQKATYFYPKVICGFLFSSVEESEFY